MDVTEGSGALPQLVGHLGSVLSDLGYSRSEAPGPWSAAWARKTWRLNRGVVVVHVPHGVDPIDHLEGVRADAARALRYVPFFYGIALQVVLVGPVGGRPASDGVDTHDNQRHVVQSVFIVDPATHQYEAIRTWGQVVSAPLQDAMSRAITACLGVQHTELATAESPSIGKAIPYLLAVVVGMSLLRLLFATG